MKTSDLSGRSFHVTDIRRYLIASILSNHWPRPTGVASTAARTTRACRDRLRQ